jgi:hypothetical protein
MVTKKTNKISDKLSKVNDSFTINMYDNGYMIEISGKDLTDDWKSVKLVCTTMAELVELIQEATELERD